MPDGCQVHAATSSNAQAVQEIAQAAQDHLRCAGSVQQIAGYSAQNIAERIQHGEAFVLDIAGSTLGSAFVEPVTPERFPQVAAWDAVSSGCPAWFLYGLVIHPEHQGRRWGRTLLHGLCHQERFAAPAVLLLDCWAGSTKLRRFYADAGFDLHGVFPEEEYEIAVFRWQTPTKIPREPAKS